MSRESSQNWFERNRPPRVHISYEVETGGAIEKKELPLVVGVLADLSGMPDPDLARSALAERRFVDIDRDSFDMVLAQIGPRIDIAGLKLGNGAPSMSGILDFQKMEDFEPENVVKKVTGLKELFAARNQLRDLMAKLDGNAKLEARLQALFLDLSGAQLSDVERNKALDQLYKESMAPAVSAVGNGAGSDAAKAEAEAKAQADAKAQAEANGAGGKPAEGAS